MTDEQKWTPEQWHVIPCPQWRNGLARIDRDPSVPWANFAEIAYASRANAHRIVACVNALAGIEDPGAVAELVEAARLYAEHDSPKYLRRLRKALRDLDQKESGE